MPWDEDDVPKNLARRTIFHLNTARHFNMSDNNNPIGVAMKLPAFAILALLCISFSFAQKKADAMPDTSHSRYSIENCVNEFSIAKAETTGVGYQYWFVDKDFLDGRTAKMSVVKPHGQTHPPHSHPEDEIFFVFEGRAEFFLDGKTKVAGPLASFYCPSMSLHGIRNVGDTVLKYLVIKKYEKN